MHYQTLRRDFMLHCLTVALLAFIFTVNFSASVSKIKQPVERDANHNTIISLCQETN